MNPTVRFQLSTMMFLQYFIWGAWYVTAPNYLGTIGFTAKDFGWTYSVGPIAGMISPLFVGMIADRFFSAQKVLAFMHIFGAAIMLIATTLMNVATPTPSHINGMLFGYMLTYYPSLALTNTVAMKNMTDPQKQFPSIRVLGTIGWIAAGLLLTAISWETTVGMFYLTAGAGLILGLFSFSLPETPPVKGERATLGQLFGLDALSLFKDPVYLVFMISSVLICIPLAFYYQIASRVVEMAGLPIGQTMSYGQMSEIFFMIVMPLFYARLGVKWMLAVGMGCWVARYALFALGAPDQVRWMILIGVIIHGVCYDFFFVTGQIYTDNRAPKKIRAQAQGLLVQLTLGLGLFIGAQLAGRVEASHTPQASKDFGQQVVAKTSEIALLEENLAKVSDGERVDLQGQIDTLTEEKRDLRAQELAAIEWKPLWGKPAIFAAIVMVLFLLFFREKNRAVRPEETENHSQ